MSFDEIERGNLSEISRLNQRGGRMLSIVDLMRAGTVSPELAAYLIMTILRGASFVVGAKPGGVGKTTVMAALLGFLPPEERIISIKSSQTVNKMREHLRDKPRFGLNSKRRFTLVCHEIGRGSWYGYLWGPVVKDYFELVDYGVRTVSNLHADSLEEILDQLGPFGVSMDTLSRIKILIFLKMSRGTGFQPKRRVASVLEAQETKTANWKYREIFHLDQSGEIHMKDKSRLVSSDGEYEETLGLVNRLRHTKEVTIRAVRDQFLDFNSSLKV